MPTGIGDEVFWLCPSLDDAGNDTGTINDLSTGGTADATLVDLNNATAWNDDTSNGGVRALLTDGDDGYAYSAPDLSDVIAGTWSLSFWLRMEQTAKTYLSFGYSDSIVPAIPYIQIRENTGNVEITAVNTIQAAIAGVQFTRPTLSTWAHYVVTMTSSGWEVWLDNVAQSLSATGSSEVPPTTQLTFDTTYGTPLDRFGLGALVQDVASAFGQGKFDDVRLFDRALTPTERTNLASQRGWEPGSGLALGRVVETNTARSVTATETVPVGRATETNTARAVTIDADGTIGQATETNVARSVYATESIAIGRVTETNTARAVTLKESARIGRVVETNTARAVTLDAPVNYRIGRATETNTARTAKAYDGNVYRIGQATETSVARSVGIAQPTALAIGRVTETNTARAVTVTETNLVRAFYRHLAGS